MIERTASSRLKKKLLTLFLKRIDGSAVALAFPTSVPLTSAKELENLGFDWILHSEKYVDGRNPDLVRLRDRVVLGASQLLGQLSPISLDSITDRFLKELATRIKAEASSVPRQELYTLCHGLRFLTLHGDTPAQLRSSINFLDEMKLQG